MAPSSGPGASPRRTVLKNSLRTAGLLVGLPLLAACGASNASAISTLTTSTVSSPSVSTVRPVVRTGQAGSTPSATTAASTQAVAGKVSVYFVSRDAPKQPDLDAFLKPWQDQYPTWDLHVDTNVNDNKLAAMVAAGQQMDVIAWYQTARKMNIAMNLFAPLDAYVARDHFNTQQYSQAVLEQTGKYDGKLYAVPYAYGGNAPFGLVYNRNLFQQAGVALPPQTWDAAWSWDDFVQAATKLTVRAGDSQTQAGIANFGYYLTTIPLLWKPARWLQDDYKTVTCDSPEMINAYQKYLDLALKERASARSPGADLGKGDPFYGGKAAMTAPCCSALSYATSMPPAIDWALAPMPKGTIISPEMAAVIGGVGTLGKQRDEGWAFLSYLLDQSHYATTVKRQPAVPADVAAWVDANFKKWPEANAKRIIPDGTQIAQAIDPLRFHPKDAEMEKNITMPAWNSMLAGKETAQQALTRIKGPLQAMSNS